MTSSATCPRCGALLPQDHDATRPCPRCLLRVGAEASSITSSTPRTPAPSLTELQPHFPRLELLALVGEGGMGAVYKARDKELDRLVALKVLTVQSEESAQFDERFAREARAMARLTHPNIAAVFDHGKAGPWSYLVLEYVDGENLRRVLRTRAVSPAEALRWVGEICSALQYAHQNGVVHRDIKPENVLVDAAGRVKVVDFGLAKLLDRRPGEATLTGTQQSLGTWHYMAPEQYEKPQSVDHRADIYSLGVVLYELLTGQVPVGRFDLPSQKVQVDVRVDEVVLKTLAREPERRYQAVHEVKSRVDDIARGPDVAAGVSNASRPSLAAVLLTTTAALGLFSLLAFVALVLAQSDDASSASDRSDVIFPLGLMLIVAGSTLGVFYGMWRRHRPWTAASHGAVLPTTRRVSPWLVLAGVLGGLLFVGLALMIGLLALMPDSAFGIESASVDGLAATAASPDPTPAGMYILAAAALIGATAFGITLVTVLLRGKRATEIAIKPRPSRIGVWIAAFGAMLFLAMLLGCLGYWFIGSDATVRNEAAPIPSPRIPDAPTSR